MPYRVTIPQFLSSMQVEAGQTILDAALKAGLEYPYACRQGNCSSCKTRILKGTAEHIKSYDKNALTDEERGEGLVLACRAAPTSPCEIEFLEDDDMTYSASTTQCVITALDRVSSDVVIVKMRPASGQPVSFLAGQFANLAIPGFPSREYSYASRPGSMELEFHVRARTYGLVSRHLYDKASVGDQISVHGPLGSAYLRKDHGGPIMIVVGGTGLAPAKSIILEAISSLPGRDISLYVSARRVEDFYLTEEMDLLATKHDNFHFYRVVTRLASDSSERSNDVFRTIQSKYKSLKDHKVYTCGSPPLVSACQKFARENGLAPSDCHADPFTEAEYDKIQVSACR
ncbi:2Fe-2S iron-sulfur cluster-binding protein [Paracoccus sp. KR1-242]|uniref:2Fe-2S iron-sulfur cluster-binding protein n=1 Tax=Paracoccus sp. KR1-242 TaxID=3410028 RepID=UPI003BFD63CE